MRLRALAIGVVAAASWAMPASAGVFGDDLARCLVRKTTDQDRTVLMQWMFSAMTAHPAVQSMTNLTPVQRAAFTQKGGALFGRLMFTDCHTETVAALKNEGVGTMETSFQVLGQVAARGLMSDPAVATQMGGIVNAIGMDKLTALVKEAGLADRAAPAAKK